MKRLDEAFDFLSARGAENSFIDKRLPAVESL
jgi:hypothetical protein